MGYDGFLEMESQEVAERGVDPKTGWRYEMRSIGMTRNASAEHRRTLKVFLDPAPHVVLDQNVPLRGWYKSKFVPVGERPRPCYTEALLTQPYGGACPVRCAFCYVNNGLRGYRGQGMTVVDPTYPQKIHKQLSRMRTAAALYISSFTEPFQPKLEPHYRNTERLAQVAIHHGLPMFFLTRQVPPSWAFDALKKNPFSYQQFSINTPDPKDWAVFSPNASTLPDLLDAVKECKKRGIYVSIQCNPVMAGVTSVEQICELIHILAQAGAAHVIFKFVEIVSPAARAMVNKAKRLFGPRGEIFEGLFTETIGHLRTIREDYRRAALDRFLVETNKAGVTMGLCYEYGYKRDGKGKVLSRDGVSLGPLYTTADQCHGRRTPVYSRPTTDLPFEPIEGCPPCGCLYCEEEGSKPCGNAKLLKADALKPSDYNMVGWTKKHGGLK